MIRTLCRGTALYDDRRRTNLHHVGDSSKIQNELGLTVNDFFTYLEAFRVWLYYTTRYEYPPSPLGEICRNFGDRTRLPVIKYRHFVSFYLIFGLGISD